MVIPLHDDNPAHGRPFVTIGLIVACVAIFFFVQPRPGSAGDERFLFENAAIPCEVTHGEPLSDRLFAECEEIQSVRPLGDEPVFPGKNVYLSLLYSMFFHGSIMHLGGNMLFLWIFGNNIEERMGRVGYLAFYLVTGFAAAAAHIFTDTSSTVPVIGASGAIAGVMGAYLLFFPRARILTIIPLFIFLQFVYLPAYVVLIAWFGLQFLTDVDSGVAVMAHIGGFVAGAGLALLLKPFLGPRRPPPPEVDFGGGFRPTRNW